MSCLHFRPSTLTVLFESWGTGARDLLPRSFIVHACNSPERTSDFSAQARHSCCRHVSYAAPHVEGTIRELGSSERASSDCRCFTPTIVLAPFQTPWHFVISRRVSFTVVVDVMIREQGRLWVCRCRQQACTSRPAGVAYIHGESRVLLQSMPQKDDGQPRSYTSNPYRQRLESGASNVRT